MASSYYLDQSLLDSSVLVFTNISGTKYAKGEGINAIIALNFLVSLCLRNFLDQDVSLDSFSGTIEYNRELTYYKRPLLLITAM